MIASHRSMTAADIVRDYDDGPCGPNYSREKEQAFRRGFIEEARRIVPAWLEPDDSFDPWGDQEAMFQLRVRVRERYTVYRRGDAGRKTYHLGYRPGHEIPAARLRGRHHALAYLLQAWDEMNDDDATFDHLILPAWLTAVERWAQSPIRTPIITPPPRPLEIHCAAAIA